MSLPLPDAVGAPPADDYWGQARRPLAALLFLLPLLALYELGLLYLAGEHAAELRNGADSWLRSGLLAAGCAHPWVLPATVIVLLGGWHLWERHPWRCNIETLAGMYAESLLFAMALVVAGQLLHCGFVRWSPETVELALGRQPALRAVGYVGAGIYEEVLFRLMLLPLCIVALRGLLPGRWPVVVGVIATSVVFAAAHYVEPAGSDSLPESFATTLQSILQRPPLWFSFVFRGMAGVVFAVLFLRRGFGVTVGCHALYDLLVGVVMQSSPESA